MAGDSDPPTGGMPPVVRIDSAVPRARVLAATGDVPAMAPESDARESIAHKHEAPTATWRQYVPTRRRSIVTIAIAAVIWLAALWVGATFGATAANSDGEPTAVIVATWMRDNNMGVVVARLEDLYYQYVDKPDVGGTPTISADVEQEDAAGITPEAQPSPTRERPGATEPPAIAHLDPPPPIVSPVADPEPKEGVWQPVGSRVEGIPAVYVTRVRADDVHTKYYASVMWIDTSLTKAMFVPGYQEPGGPNPYNGALPEDLWPDVLANFNGAFRLADSMAGYYYDGTTVRPLVDGKASAVLYRDGTIRIGSWGRDVSMSDDVLAVRQNLDLIVDDGRSKVKNATDNYLWGATTDKESLAWRAAIGQRPDGSIVYVGAPYLSAEGLADTLVGAGVERAMVLDMNNWWTAGFYFRHKPDGTPVCRKLDPAIQEGCDRFLKPYKRDSFQFLARRDLVPSK